MESIFKKVERKLVYFNLASRKVEAPPFATKTLTLIQLLLGAVVHRIL